jgi:hypothetical protein
MEPIEPIMTGRELQLRMHAAFRIADRVAMLSERLPPYARIMSDGSCRKTCPA